jgi:hypothetical protein
MTVPEALLAAIIGAFFVAIGLTAFAVSWLRGWSRDRAAPLFGVFVLLYGVRLLCKSSLVWEATGLPETWFRFTEDWITYAILAPGAMFVEAIAPPAYRTIARRLWQVDLIYAALSIGADIVSPARLRAPDKSDRGDHSFCVRRGFSDRIVSEKLPRTIAASGALGSDRRHNRRVHFHGSCRI